MFESNALGLWGSESEDIIKRDFPIHRACRDGDLDSLYRLRAVASRDRLTEEDKFYGWTPIHWAAYFGNIDCLSELLRMGIGPNLRTTKFKQTPCHTASFGGHPQCLIKLLKSGADFHAKDYMGETPIHKAARVGNLESIQVLLDHGSRVNLCNNSGHTPTDMARMQGFLECVKLLETPKLQSMNFSLFNSGSSGASLNGCHFLNGVNSNGVLRQRKRVCEDESIPIFKRTRLDTHQESNGVLNGSTLLSHCDENFEDCNGNGMYQNGDEMDTGMDMDESDLNGHCSGECVPDDICPRAPSPGMDIRLETDSDLQLWSHHNGYGDTAETIPSPPKYKNHFNGGDRPTCTAFRGIQSRGWH